jgi:hypothetical protein
MKLPGFTAESSLRRATTQHFLRQTDYGGRRGVGVVSQQFFGGIAAWSWWRRCPTGCVPTGNPWRPCLCFTTGAPFVP